MRFSVDFGPETVRATRISVILSPDGTRMVFSLLGRLDAIVHAPTGSAERYAPYELRKVGTPQPLLFTRRGMDRF